MNKNERNRIWMARWAKDNMQKGNKIWKVKKLSLVS